MQPIRVLHVDDDEAFAKLIDAHLTRTGSPFDITFEQSPEAALSVLNTDSSSIDCIVSDFDMPQQNGLEFLRAVREQNPSLPFILYTGKGSEEVASDAISAGATDYLQKRAGTGQHDLLANRIRNAAEQYRYERERDRVYQALETATEGIGVLDNDGRYAYVNDAYADMYQYAPGELIGQHWSCLYSGDEIARFENEILPTLKADGTWQGMSEGQTASGDHFPERLSLTQLEDGGHVCVVRDISGLRERERQFERLIQNVRGVVYRCRNEPGWPLEFLRGDVTTLLELPPDEPDPKIERWGEVIHPADSDRVWKEVQAAIDAGEVFDLRYRIQPTNRGTKWITERGCAVTDRSGEPVAIEGVITDVTGEDSPADHN